MLFPWKTAVREIMFHHHFLAKSSSELITSILVYDNLGIPIFPMSIKLNQYMCIFHDLPHDLPMFIFRVPKIESTSHLKRQCHPAQPWGSSPCLVLPIPLGSAPPRPQRRSPSDPCRRRCPRAAQPAVRSSTLGSEAWTKWWNHQGKWWVKPGKSRFFMGNLMNIYENEHGGDHG